MAICTYNVRLNPSESTKTYWLSMLEECAEAYNFCCNFLTSNDIPMTVKEVHKALYYKIRSKHPSLSSQTAIKIYKDAMSAVRSIRSNKHTDAKIPTKTNLSLRLDKRIYSRLGIDGISISDGTMGKREHVPFILYPKAAEMFASYTCADPLVFVRDGELWLSVPFEVPNKPVLSDMAVGVDLGERQLFVTSEGKSFSDKKYLAAKRRVRHKKSQLKSVGTKSARRKLRKLSKRERNLTKDMCRRAATARLESTSAGYVILEDLKGIKKKTSRTKDGFRRKKHNKRMAQVPFHEFKEELSHKAPLYGKRVETVSPAYTSQTDSRTGRRDGERKGRRYICKDGTVLDADWNAAVNIAHKGKHPVSSATVPVDGGLTPLTGRLTSTSPLHCKPSLEVLQAAKSLA